MNDDKAKGIVQNIKDDLKDEQIKKNVDEMKKNMNILLYLLTEPNDVFDSQTFLEKLKSYIDLYKRLLYSEISINVYQLSRNNGLPSFISNVELACNYAISKDIEIKDEITKVTIKLLDHVNLASNQVDSLLMNEQKFAEHAQPIIKQLEDTENDLITTKKDLETSKNNHMSQLISIVAIFTALSFIGTGGIYSLSTLFKDIENVPLTQSITLGSLLAMTILNLLYFFMYFISKMTGMKIGHGKDEDPLLVRYAFFFLMNITLLCIFIVAFIIFFVFKYNDPLTYPYFTAVINNRWSLIIGTMLFAISAIIYILCLCSKSNKKNEQKKSDSKTE